ncbi:MAG: NAD(P)H-binding protein [Williamsia sp.]|nr:NAD(P)H-binding protein [Williamsia sp.]
MKIVLTGSLGHIGKPLAQQLVQEGHAVTVISSNPEKQGEIHALGAVAAIGKLDDTDFLAGTFRDADAVYCMIPPNFAQPDQLAYYQDLGNRYAEAIRISGVKRVVDLSSYGAHLPEGTGLIRGSYKVEQTLNAVPGISLTHVRPTYFYYNLLSFTGMIRTAGFIGAVYGGEDRLTMVSPEDIAAAVAEELQITENTNPVRYVASDDRTCKEVASVLGSAIGMPHLKWLALPKEQVLQSLAASGLPGNIAGNLVELGEAIHSGKLREDYDRHTPLQGKVKLEEWAREFARVFNSK